MHSPIVPRFLLPILATLLLPAPALYAEGDERPPKSPEGKVRVIEKGEIVSYVMTKRIGIHVTRDGGKGSGGDAGNKLEFPIPQGQWPHLGSIFFEVIFVPPPGYDRDFPVHSPMRSDSVQPGQPVWFAQEGLSRKSLELYQLAIRIPAHTPAEFNATVRNAVKLRESRHQEEIARDYQCRLIEFPAGSGTYPDDPKLLEKYVPAGSIFPDRLDVKAPPPGAHGYGKGLKSSDLYENGIGAENRNRKER